MHAQAELPAFDPETFQGVYQKTRTDEGGDCFAACVASIMGVTLDDLPTPHAPFGHPDVNARLGNWLYARGLQLEEFTVDEQEGPPAGIGLWIAGIHYQHHWGGHATVWNGREFRWCPSLGTVYAHPPHTIPKGWKLSRRLVDDQAAREQRNALLAQHRAELERMLEAEEL